MLHGAQQHPDDFAAGTQMNVAAEDAGFIVAYPEQPDSTNLLRCWNNLLAVEQMHGIANVTMESDQRHGARPSHVLFAFWRADRASAVAHRARRRALLGTSPMRLTAVDQRPVVTDVDVLMAGAGQASDCRTERMTIQANRTYMGMSHLKRRATMHQRTG
ncbi:PHB depolymerase family esterase [Caballeronia sp. LZ035]|uniref:PHB depolymerase family esterase n=1 Tax=Caballeronia sp. LZ035 TaxID=3038568 RepID=UPI002859ECD4|nr:PHB depolymerase family esterase [Caballeronia sp. LZ035]MDR5758966.1 PHB depolymerase family esterase [Caballeronia sp. LZ035]